jgi:hypothetical protein
MKLSSRYTTLGVRSSAQVHRVRLLGVNEIKWGRDDTRPTGDYTMASKVELKVRKGLLQVSMDGRESYWYLLR